MTLCELIEELREGILHDVSDQVEGASDYLWSDRRLVRYINEAERRFARESLCLRDGTTPEICHVRTEPFRREYALHESVLGVLSVRCEGDKADLARAGHALFNVYHEPDTYFFDPSTLNALPPGKMRAFDTDEYIARDDRGSLSRVNLRVYPSPDFVHVQKLFLRVVRLPKNHLTIGKYQSIKDIPASEFDTFLGVSPEIPENHHLDMLLWAAHLALRIVDRDMGDPERAAEFATAFEAKTKEARDIAMRKMFAVSAWGFGRNGFSWETN